MSSSLFGGGSSTTTSTPRDMTPPAFQAMQGPLASALMFLAGTGGPTYNGAGSATSPFNFATPPFFGLPGTTPSSTGVSGTPTPPTPTRGVGINQGGSGFGPTGFMGGGGRGFSVGGSGGGDSGGSMIGASLAPGQMPTMGATSPTGMPLSMSPAATSPASASPFSAAGGGYGAGSSFFSPTGNTGATGTGAGTFTAGLSPAEQSMLSNIYGIGSGPNNAVQSAQSYLNNILQPNYATGVVNSQPVQAAVQAATNPLITAFNETTMPSLKGQFAAGGHVLNGPGMGTGGAEVGGGSSPFSHAAALAETGLGQNIASATSNIENQAYQSALGQQTQAATQAPQLQSSEVQNLVSTLQAEALPRLIDQYGLDQGLQEFNNRLNVMLQSLGLAAGKAGPFVANSSSGSSSYSPGIIPSVDNLLFGSDVRLKTDITRVGITKHGLPLYTFRYRGRPELFEGVMAHDVRKVMPKAVAYDERGFASVNYGMLGIPFKQVA